MSWIGGVGVGVTYTYDVSSSGVIVTSGNYSTTALGVDPTRITLTDKTAKSYTVVVKATNGVGTVVSVASGIVTTLSPVIQVLPLTTTGTTGANTLVMTADTTTISGITGSYNFMNGIYIASTSSYSEGGIPYKLFDGTDKSIWHCAYMNATSSLGYGQNPYSTTYQGGGTGLYWSTVVSGSAVNGEWVQIKFPYAFLLSSYKIYTRVDSGVVQLWSWKDFVLAGSNNGTTWYLVDSRTYTTTAPTSGDTLTVTSPSVNYSYYRFIITSVMTQTNVATCGELNLFGTY
jgi:hypothetical protein